MPTVRGTLTAGQAILLGVAVVGCATAATITGHLSGAELVSILTMVGGGTAGVVGAHVGASQVSAAWGATTQTAPGAPAPSSTGGPSVPPPPVGAQVIGAPGALR